MALTGQSLAVGVESLLRDEMAARSPSLQLGFGGANGKSYIELKKGTSYYQQLIDDVASVPSPYIVPGIFVVHGERDMNNGTTQATYEGYLDEWLTDYDTDIKAVTGQAEDVFFIVSQVNSWTEYELPGPTMGLAQLAASLSNPDIHLMGPVYQLGYGGDSVHLTATGYARLAQLFDRTLTAVLAGTYGGPLRPLSAVRSGAVITIQFDVPEGVLAFDTTIVAEQSNYGFSYEDDTSSAAISSVALGGDGTSVEVTLDATPTGANPTIGYGRTTQFGNLRDTSADTFDDGQGMHNWCVHFVEDVTT